MLVGHMILEDYYPIQCLGRTGFQNQVQKGASNLEGFMLQYMDAFVTNVVPDSLHQENHFLTFLVCTARLFHKNLILGCVYYVRMLVCRKEAHDILV